MLLQSADVQVSCRDMKATASAIPGLDGPLRLTLATRITIGRFLLIPIFILSLILRRFHSGTGEAVSLRELKKQFNLPSSWITKSVEALCALRYVRIASQSAREGLEEEMILPTRPADQISIQQLVRDIAQETTSWLETWPTDIPIEVRTLAQRIARGDLPTTSLAEFL